MRQKPLGAIGGVILTVLVIMAVFAPLVARNVSPTKTSLREAAVAPNASHWLGTDIKGRDQWSRIVYGARISLRVGLLSVAFGSAVGALLGMTSAYIGGRFDLLVQRLIDMLQAFPALILAMIVVTVLGRSINNLIVAIAIVLIPNACRVIRGAAFSVKANLYVEAARVLGAGDLRIVLRHILPNVVPPFLIIASLAIGSTIITEASLSFLGLGVQPPTPSWGSMLQDAQNDLTRAPWLAIFPGIAISLVVFGANMFGDALRDVLDPRLRGSR